MTTTKTKVFFVIISLLLLGGFFLMIMLDKIFGGITETSVQNPVENVLSQPDNLADPLITSAKDVYYAFIRSDDPVRGNEEAKLKILAFEDYECPYCAQIQPNLISAILDFDGQVSLVWKDFPNPLHLNAKQAALAARCAGEQGQFWPYHDYLYMNNDKLSRELYNKIALELNLNLEQFNTCLETEKYIEAVGQGLEDGQRLGVNATPYLMIGNSEIDWAASEEDIAAVIRRELGN